MTAPGPTDSTNNGKIALARIKRNGGAGKMKSQHLNKCIVKMCMESTFEQISRYMQNDDVVVRGGQVGIT